MSSANSTVSDTSSLSEAETPPSEEQVLETDAGEAEAAATDLSVDVIFEVLKNERRRRVIQYLRTNDGPAELGSLAEHIAALENDKEEAAITYAERKRVYVGLYQCHLPKMDDMGVVDFNRARGRIELTDRVDELTPYLEGPAGERPWHHYYGGVVMGGVALYGVALADVLPAFTPQVALLGVLAALAVCTLGHARTES